MPSPCRTVNFQMNMLVGSLCSVLSTSYARPYLEEIGYAVVPKSANTLVFVAQTSLVILMYIIVYFGVASAFEYTHPDSAFSNKTDKKTKERWHSVTYSMYYSSLAIVLCVIYAMSWIRWVEPILPYYGYWAQPGNTYSVFSFVKELALYMLLFDTWFYWTHRLLHMRKPINFWTPIHTIHHDIVNPTAFAQDATHPFEALLQGPIGHHLINLIAPIHPVSHALFGFCTSVFAIAAHDAREWDLNDHHKHHHYCHVNFGLYWGLWDYICGTRYSKGKYERLQKWGQDPFKDAELKKNWKKAD